MTNKRKKIYLAMLLTLLLCFMSLTIAVLGENVQTINSQAYKIVSSYSFDKLTTAMIWISNFADVPIYLVILPLLLIFKKTRFKFGVPITTAVIFTVISNQLLKRILAVQRPNINMLVEETGFGFPSGHSMNIIVFAGLLAYLFVTNYKGKNKTAITILTTILSITFITLVGISRIYLGVHNPTDVIGAYLIGSSILLASILILQKQSVINFRNRKL